LKLKLKNKLIYLKIFIGLSILLYLFLQYDLKKIFTNIFILSIYQIGIIWFFAFFQTLINAIIMKKSFKIFGINENILSLYKRILAGLFYGQIFPSTIGRDTYYVSYFGKKYRKYLEIFSAIFLARFFGFFVSFVLFILSLFYLKEKIYLSSSFIKKIEIMIPLALIFIIGIFFLFKNFLSSKWEGIKNRFKNMVKYFQNSFLNVTFLLLLTILFYSVSIGAKLYIGSVLNIKMDFLKIASIIVVTNFIIMFPISISGIGVREGTYTVLLSSFGVDGETAISFSLLDFSMTIILIITGGALVQFENYLRLRKKKMK